MQFSTVVLFAASALAASSTITETAFSTQTQTITSCDESVTNCPAKNHTISGSTFTGAAAVGSGSFYAAGAAALAAGALLM
jgi:hypothetical protein